MNQNALPPADLNKLRNILGNAKALINKVEGGNYETGNVNLDTSVTGEQLVENSGGHTNTSGPSTSNVAPKVVNGQAQYKNMNTSKMPAHIKEAMMKQPIPQMSMAGTTFSLDDVSELVDKPLPTTLSNPKRPASIQENRQPIVQNVNDSFTVSETALRGIIKDVVKDELLEFMSETFTKKLTEQAIKKTINTLIREGKITTKKKVNS